MIRLMQFRNSNTKISETIEWSSESERDKDDNEEENEGSTNDDADVEPMKKCNGAYEI